jgi:hypothetical protein
MTGQLALVQLLVLQVRELLVPPALALVQEQALVQELTQPQVPDVESRQAQR